MVMHAKPTRCEIWPVVPDDVGLWLISGAEPWLTDPIEADQTEFGEVDFMLREHAIAKDMLAALHGTSWRDGFDWRTDTFMAALNPVAAARELWPNACPITVELAEQVGPPPTHDACEEPQPPDLAVLYHGLGHLKDWYDRNREARDKLGPVWRERLKPFEKTLAGMYEQPHIPAA